MTPQFPDFLDLRGAIFAVVVNTVVIVDYYTDFPPVVATAVANLIGIVGYGLWRSMGTETEE